MPSTRARSFCRPSCGSCDTSGLSEYGRAATFRWAGVLAHHIDLIAQRIDGAAADAAPRNAVTTSVVSVSSPASSACAARYNACTPRSDGIESKPHECTMRAPVRWATSSNRSMLSRWNRTSPR